MPRGRALLILAALALAGCSGRERANPLDPHNPATGGRPTGFNAVARFSAIALSWTPRSALDITGFRLERFVAADTGWVTLSASLPPGSSGYLDGGTLNGTLYRYRLYYVVNGARFGPPAEDEAESGPVIAWVADPGAREVDEVSPDGRDVVVRYSAFGEAQSLDVDPANGTLWTCDTFGGRATVFQPQNSIGTDLVGPGQPYQVAVDPADHGAWITDERGSLWHFQADGRSAPPGSIGLLDLPAGVAVSPRDQSVWVCEYGGSRVRHFAADGTPLGSTPVDRPTRVAVDSLSQRVWVTSVNRGRIWRLSPTGALLDSTSVAIGPLGLALDWRHGRAWIADAIGGRVLGLDLATMAVVGNIGGLPGARDVAVDPGSGDVWAVVEGSASLVRIRADGVVLQTLRGFVDPTEVRIDPGIR